MLCYIMKATFKSLIYKVEGYLCGDNECKLYIKVWLTILAKYNLPAEDHSSGYNETKRHHTNIKERRVLVECG